MPILPQKGLNFMASFIKRGAKWRYKINYTLDGEYKQKTKDGFRTKKEAQIAAAEAELILSQGFDRNKGDTPFYEYYSEWAELYRIGQSSKGTDYNYKICKDFILKYFKNKKINEITRTNYQKAMNTFGETHSLKTVKLRHIYIKMCFEDAFNEGHIHKNPVYKISLSGKVAPKKEVDKFMDIADLKIIINSIKRKIEDEKNTMPQYPALLFMIATGVRYSECAALTWDCVYDGYIEINKSWDHNYTKDFAKTKTKESNRKITIDPETQLLLKEIKKRQCLENDLNNALNLVFNYSGVPVKIKTINNTLKKTCKENRIREITCHGLRHTHGSILLYEGVNIKYLSRRLGHSDIATTLNVYMHILDEMEQKESRHVDEILEKLYKEK